jgi:hypothetical protein
MKACNVDGCQEAHYSVGLCKRHYAAKRRNGDPTITHKPRGTLEERFWRKVDKRGDGECWPWTANKTADKRYGSIHDGGGKRGTNLMAHRVSYELHHGPVPEGLYVLHSCDNPSCVNPKHLRAGSAKENTQDAIQRGRLKNPPVMAGETNVKSKLTAQQVKFIRENPSVSTYALAQLLGVHYSTVQRIKTDTSWKSSITPSKTAF